MEKIQPSLNRYFIGHKEAEQVFLNAWKNNSLHNSWLITGVEGIGKATFAYRLARFLLSADQNRRNDYSTLDVASDNPNLRLIAKNSHPDLKVIERDYIETDKKKIIKAIKEGEALDEDQLQDLKKSSVIKVDEIRTINEFLSKKSFDGRWRIVLIDSVDELNPASANAILKILEEPPVKSIMLLISHNPNCLLPTIRSRCAKMNLQPLSIHDVALLLERYMPELSEKEIQGLAEISSGSIGKAMNFAEHHGLEIYNIIKKLFIGKVQFDLAEAIELCDKASRDENTWNLVTELILKQLSIALKQGTNVKQLGEAWDKSSRILRDTEALNMDKKQALINVISTICRAL